MNSLDLSEINPGVRSLVALLRSKGFRTTDSGDGVTNIGKFEGALDYPHVFMRADHERDAIKLMSVLHGQGVMVKPGMIQYSYDPTDGSRVLSLSHVSDKDLRP